MVGRIPDMFIILMSSLGVMLIANQEDYSDIDIIVDGIDIKHSFEEN
jgi:predicted nucleotidyltransferase